MRTKSAVAILFLICCAHAKGQASIGAKTATTNFGKWTVTVLNSSNRMIVRASTPSQNDVLAFDTSLPDCMTNAKIIFPFPKPAEEDMAAIEVMVNARIDSGDVRTFGSASDSVTMGDPGMFVNIPLNDATTPLVSEMTHGGTVRFSLNFPKGTPVYESFSLDGFAPAAQTALRACEEFSKDPATMKRLGRPVPGLKKFNTL